MDSKLLISIDEFCEIYADIGMDAARKIVKRPDFPKIKVGNRVKIIIKEVNNWLVEHTGEEF
ncbi:MAG: helix-turn-helix domain-containing protein [Tissierellia bacterium]|nr:helix-turn-helix domain-containing protein [Tissierellia bacterium]